MEKKYFFLSGIARSGSTLLGSILNQNPAIFVSPTSPLMDMYCLQEQNLVSMTHQYTYDYPTVSKELNRVLMPNFYKHIDKPIIIDKHRGWPRNVEVVQNLVGLDPKIICTWRPVAENICSFLKLMSKDPNNSVDRELKEKGLELNTRNRALHLWRNYSSDPYESLKFGLKRHRKNILIVKYDDIVSNPQFAVDSIYDFLGIDHYQHTFKNISNTCSESKDTAWGFEGLHNIRDTITKTSSDPLEILGPELFKYFNKFDSELAL